METALSPWGKSVAINLFDCQQEFLMDPDKITQYIGDIIKHIKMVAHGPCHIERFGYGTLEGYSALQFIETSSITLHADEVSKRCFIDIFSCKDFDTEDAARFSQKFFGAQTMNQTTIWR